MFVMFRIFSFLKVNTQKYYTFCPILYICIDILFIIYF